MSDSTLVDWPQTLRRNWNYTAHVIRDIHGQLVGANPFILTDDPTCMFDFWSSEHWLNFSLISIGKLNGLKIDNFEAKYFEWDPYNKHSLPSDLRTKFLLSIDYNPHSSFHELPAGLIAFRLNKTLEDEALVVLVNPGIWAMGLAFMNRRYDLEQAWKQYSMFKNEDVMVYQK